MADLYEQLLDSIDTLTPEQLAELASIINARQLKPEKEKEEIPSDTSSIKIIGKILKIRCRFFTFQIIPMYVKRLLTNIRNRPAPVCQALAKRMYI